MVKITRDAELDLEEDVSISYLEKITLSVKDRMISDPVRLVYDKEIPDQTLCFVMEKLNIDGTDSLIPGGKYHQRRDYMNFPSLDRPDLLYSSFPSFPYPCLVWKKIYWMLLIKKTIYSILPIKIFLMSLSF